MFSISIPPTTKSIGHRANSSSSTTYQTTIVITKPRTQTSKIFEYLSPLYNSLITPLTDQQQPLEIAQLSISTSTGRSLDCSHNFIALSPLIIVERKKPVLQFINFDGIKKNGFKLTPANSTVLFRGHSHQHKLHEILILKTRRMEDYIKLEKLKTNGYLFSEVKDLHHTCQIINTILN